MGSVLVSGSFDDLNSRQVRFLQEAARSGTLHLLLWSDRLAQALTGSRPKFPQAERRYFVEALRFVDQVRVVDELDSADGLPAECCQLSNTWVVPATADGAAKRAFCQSRGIAYRVIADEAPRGFSVPLKDETLVQAVGRKKVVVTGCFDWLHTGHVRFFEEVAQLGDLYVVVGSDANVRLLKGEQHPLFREDERLYMVQAIRYVTEARVSTGTGWMDAAPEIAQIRPDIYAVNEDGDQPAKRAFCEEQGLQYVVLKRAPKEGLPQRESTQLRGF